MHQVLWQEETHIYQANNSYNTNYFTIKWELWSIQAQTNSSACGRMTPSE